MRRILVSLAFLSALVGSARVALAANTSTLGAVTLRPTIAAIGVDAAISGDDNGNASVELWLRKSGDPDFTQGHRLLRSGARALGSAMFVDPSTAYDIKVVLNDPDNGAPLEATQTATTRADSPPPSSGPDLYVDASLGSDSNNGSAGSPFASIQAAVGAAGPGAIIHVAAGVYRESVTVDGTHGGSATNPLRILGDHGAIIDGSDPSLEDGSAFTDQGSGIWSAPFQGECRYVAVDDTRIYDFASLAALQAGAAGIDGGFFVDTAASRIYVRLPGGASPAGHAIHVAHLAVGFMLDTVSDVVIEGFELRYFGTVQDSGVGVDVRDTSRAWVRDNDIHHINNGVRIRRSTASDNVVEGNTIRDTSVWTWPWDAVKAHTAEATGVSVTGGAGNVVRRNVIQGTFNGVYVGSFDDPSEAVAPYTDVYENVLSQHGDDGLEPEGACVNVRFWNNAIHGVHNGISLSPIEVGPVFVVRNLFDGYGAHALKINNGPQGWMLIYHNTSVPSDAADAQALAPSEPFQHMITRNNIWAAHRYVVESSVTPSGPLDLDFDDLFTDSADGTPRFVKWLDVRYADLGELQASNTIEQHGFSIEPQYEDPAGGDFTPVAGSPLIDVGEPIPGINDRFTTGAGPDLGAFERGGVAPGNDAGVPDGSAGSGGGSTGGAGGSAGSADGGTTPDGGGSGGADSGSAGAPPSDYPGEPVDGGGCGCELNGVAGAGPFGMILTLLSIAAMRRRRNDRLSPRP